MRRISGRRSNFELALLIIVSALVVPVQAADLVDVVKKVEGAVVRINTDAGLGSGAIVSQDGLIVTNFHVIENATKAQVTLRNGRKLDCSGYLVADPSRDLAILRIDASAVETSLQLATALPEVGTRVAAFGNPQGFSFTTSEGIVSAVRTTKQLHEDFPEFAATGHALDATWVQTTAAISSGNSGGPLVTMECQLVGINTWGYTMGQQLNFAISAIDVRRMLTKVTSKSPVRAFATLPKRGKRPVVTQSPDEIASYRLELPTGRVFGFEVFATDHVKLRQLSAEQPGHSMVVISHPNGSQFAAASQVGGVLNGVTVASWDNREPMVEVTYLEGRRHGVLNTWDEAGKRVVSGQYQNGRRHGFTVLWENHLPQMVAQYSHDRLEYLQLMKVLTPLEGFASVDEAMKHPKAKAILERLEKVDTELKKNEFQFRRQVKAFEAERRRELAAQLGPEKRARALDRARQRNEQNESFLREMRRRTHGF